jgi:hypothetical protein
MMLKWLFSAVVLYGGFVALLYVAQRSLQYFPERQRTAPSAAGVSEAEELVLDTADGERVIVRRLAQSRPATRQVGGRRAHGRVLTVLPAVLPGL